MMTKSRDNAKPTLVKRALACLVSAAMVVAFTPVVALGASATNVMYVNENGAKKTCSNATVVTDSTTSWSNGWYVVNNNVAIDSRITVTGDVHLILADRCALTANYGIQVQDNDSNLNNGSANSLTIYAQSLPVLKADGTVDEANNGVGKLIAKASNGDASIGGSTDGTPYGFGHVGGSITVIGGVVTATSTAHGAGIGGSGGGTFSTAGTGGSGGSVTVRGGVVTAASTYGAGIGGGSSADTAGTGGSGGSVTVRGGVVAAASTYGAGIGGGTSSIGTFSTGADGCAVVFASSIADKSSQGSWCGLIFDEIGGKIYGERFELNASLEIPAGRQLTIESDKTFAIADGKTLTVSENATLTNSGTVENSGTVDNSGRIDNGGRLANSGTVENSGTLSIADGGALANSGSIENGSGGTVENSGTVDNSGRIDNGGALANSGTVKNSGGISNSGTVENRSGSTIANSGTLSIADGGTLNNAGSIENSIAGTVENYGRIDNVGTLNNAGSIENRSGSTIANSGTFENSGTVENSSVVSIADGATLANSGSIENIGSGAITGNMPTNTGSGTISSTVTYVTNSDLVPGNSLTPSFYTYSKEGEDILLQDVSKTGHTFNGWYDEAGNLVTKFNTHDLSAKTYYAKWTPTTRLIKASLCDYNFGVLEYGSPVPAAASNTFRIESSIESNTGNEAVPVVLDKPVLTNEAFEITSFDRDVDGSLAEITVRPKVDGLAVGTYCGVIKITGSSTAVAARALNEDGTSQTAPDAETYISVSFTVKKAVPEITVTPSSSNVQSGTVVGFEIGTGKWNLQGAEFSLECTQGPLPSSAREVSIGQIDSKRFRVVAPSFPGTYCFRAELKETGNYSAASAECEISVIPDLIYDLPFEPPANETTIDVGNGQEIGVVVSGGQAAVKEISPELLQTITTGEGSGLQSSLVLDLSSTGSKVTSTKISKESVGNIAGAANSSKGGLESLTVKMTSGSVGLNKEALFSVTSQASGSALVIALEEQEKAELNALQQLALGYERALYGCFGVTVTSGGSEIHEFGSGAATLSFTFKPAPNTDPKNYRLVHVSETGKLEYCPTTLKGNVLSGTTYHLSTYAIVYIEPAAETLALAAELEALPAAGKLKAAGAKAAVKAAKRALKQVAALDEEQRAVVGKALVDNAEQVAERGTALIAKADAKAAKKVKSKAFSVKAGTSKSIAFKTKASSAGTKVTYAKLKGSKLITVTKSGKVTAKKSMKEDRTYTAKVKVSCGKAAEYVKVKVKAR